MNHESVHSHLTWVFSNMENTEWDAFNVEEQTHHLARFISETWRAHAFREGNTRTTIIFLSEFAKYIQRISPSNLFIC